MTLDTLPTRRDEAYRYSDIDAMAAMWPLPAAQAITVPAGGAWRRAIAVEAGGVTRIDLLLGAGATGRLHLLHSGGFARLELTVTLHEGADFVLNAAQIAGGNDRLEIISTVRHVEPDATSRQLVRAISGDAATVTYLGKVEVARGAQGTDSGQDVKAMLLSRQATANAVPQLEIFADDVACAHGCAIGELDQTALFYLQSRGLPLPEAKRLLLEAFVSGVFDDADDADVLKAAALHRLGQLV